MSRLTSLLFASLLLTLLVSNLAFAGEVDFDGLVQGDALAGLSQDGASEGLSKAERSDLSSLGLGEKELGAFQAASRSGFDIYRDTPTFKNFSGALSKGGTCTGVSTFVKLMFMNVTFDPSPKSGVDAVEEALEIMLSPVLTRRTLHGARDFREFCELHPNFEGRLKTMMQVAHLNNLNPQTLRATVEGRLGLQSGKGTVGRFALRAENGCPSLVIMNPKGLGTGHCCLTYKVLRFEKASLVYVYDPNTIYDPAQKNHRQTLLKLDRASDDLRLFPEAYDQRYGGKYDRITCAEGMMGVIIENLRGLGGGIISRAGDVIEGARSFGERTLDGLANMGNAAGDVIGRIF